MSHSGIFELSIRGYIFPDFFDTTKLGSRLIRVDAFMISTRDSIYVAELGFVAIIIGLFDNPSNELRRRSSYDDESIRLRDDRSSLHTSFFNLF